MTTIIVTHEDNEIDEFQFDAAQHTITLGRRATNDVCIPDLSVSGNHATITIHNDKVVLQDLNSTNGSYVNGQVIQRTTLHPGDEIILGKILLNVSSDVLLANPRSDELDIENLLPSQSSEGAAQGAFMLNDPPPMEEIAYQREADSPEPSAANSEGDTVLASVPTADHETRGNSHKQQHSKASEPHPLDGLEHVVVPATKPTATPMHELDTPSGMSKGAVIEIKNGAKSGQILPIDKPVTTLGRPGIQIAAIMRKPDGYFLMHIESDGNVDKPTLNSDAVGDEPVLLHSGDKLTVAGIAVEFMLS